MAHDTRRLLEAAGALHTHLRAAGVPHAFYGSFEVALLSNSPSTDVSPRCHTTDCQQPDNAQEIFCIVEGGSAHPYGRVRQACAEASEIATRSSPWSNRCA